MIEPRYKKQKPLLNENEIRFYHKLKIVIGSNFLIVPQVHIEKLIAPKWWRGGYKYAFGHVSRWSVDFGIFDINTLDPLIAIELNGKSHNKENIILSDKHKKSHFDEAGIPLVVFLNSEIDSLSYEDIRKRLNIFK